MDNELWRSLKFLLFSISAGLIELGSLTILNDLLHISYWISYFVALVLSVLWNFTFNRRYTFQSAENVGKAMTMVFLFYLVFTPLSTFMAWFLVDLHGWNNHLVTAIIMILNFVTEFPYQRFVVYRNSLDTNDLARKNT